VSDLATVLQAPPATNRPPLCKRCGRRPTTHTLKIGVNAVGPKRNGSGPSAGGRSRTLCEECATAVAAVLVAVLDLDGAA
jgi:hypothetical protein